MISNSDACIWHNYRLPTHIIPQAYRLVLETILVEKSNVTGYIEIDISSDEPMQCIVLHATGMQIDSVTAIQGTLEIEGTALYLRH